MLLYTKIRTALSRKPIRIRHKFIKTFLLKLTDAFTFRNIYFTYEITLYIHIAHLNSEITLYTECPRRNLPDFGRVFLMLNYNDITQNTYIRS